MPGSGTDKTKRWIETPGPVIVLVEPQLGENIGAAARAMANFGLSKLRLVKPVQGWPNEKAGPASVGALDMMPPVRVFTRTEDALADLNLVYAATARDRRMLSTYSTRLISTCLVDSRLRASHATTGTSLEIARASRTSCGSWYCTPSKQLIATR